MFCPEKQYSHGLAIVLSSRNCFSNGPFLDVIYKIYLQEAKSRKYLGMFEVHRKITTSSGKGLISTSRTYACKSKMGRTRCPEDKAFPLGMHPSQMFYRNLSKFDKRSSWARRPRFDIKSVQ